MELIQNTVVIRMRNSVDGENSRLDTTEMRVHEWKMALRAPRDVQENAVQQQHNGGEKERFNMLTPVIKFPGKKQKQKLRQYLEK